MDVFPAVLLPMSIFVESFQFCKCALKKRQERKEKEIALRIFFEIVYFRKDLCHVSGDYKIIHFQFFFYGIQYWHFIHCLGVS